MIYKTDEDYYGSTLFRCLCHDTLHFFEVMYDKDDKELWFNVVYDRDNLFKTLYSWFRGRKEYLANIILVREDVVVLRDKLNEYLDETK